MSRNHLLFCFPASVLDVTSPQRVPVFFPAAPNASFSGTHSRREAVPRQTQLTVEGLNFGDPERVHISVINGCSGCYHHPRKGLIPFTPASPAPLAPALSSADARRSPGTCLSGTFHTDGVGPQASSRGGALPFASCVTVRARCGGHRRGFLFIYPLPACGHSGCLCSLPARHKAVVNVPAQAFLGTCSSFSWGPRDALAGPLVTVFSTLRDCEPFPTAAAPCWGPASTVLGFLFLCPLPELDTTRLLGLPS